MDQIARFFLLFSNEFFIIPLLIIGYIWIDRKIFLSTICLLLISSIYNTALKSTFQVPLHPSIGKEGFAFPSGHMTSAYMVYGWLFTKTNSILLRALFIILLTGVAVGLVHFQYHVYFDIFGSLVFGSMLMGAFWYLENYKPKLLRPILLAFAASLIIYIATIYQVKEDKWLAFYALIGVIISDKYFSHKPKVSNFNSKMLGTAFCFGVIIAFHFLFEKLNFPVYISQIYWIIVGFSVPMSVHLLDARAKKGK